MREGALYGQVFDRLRDDISAGRLLPGERLPSVRVYSQQLGVSKNTVLQAYARLEERGYIMAREKQGFFVTSRDEESVVPSFPTRQVRVERLDVVDEVQWTLDALADPDIINVSAALPDPKLIPNAQVARFMRQHADKISTYADPRGELSLRQALERRYREREANWNADDVVITSGALEAIHLVLSALCRPGDIVLIENPTYYMYFKVLRALGLTAVAISSSATDGINLQEVERALKSERVAAILVQPHFSNPLGSEMSEQAKERLVALAHKFSVPLLQDDINGELAFDGRKRRSLLSFPQADQVIFISSFSKMFSPGVRIGWIISPKHHEIFKQAKSRLSVCQSSPGQLAMADFLNKGNPERWLKKMRKTLAARFLDYKHFILNHFPKGTSMTHPGGGFVTWVKLPLEYDAMALSRQARKRGIVLTAGPIFSADQSFGNCLRFNYAFALEGKQLKAMKEIAALLA